MSTNIPLYERLRHCALPKGGLPDRDRGEADLDASTSISASFRGANLLCIWIGSLNVPFPNVSPIFVLFVRGTEGLLAVGGLGFKAPSLSKNAPPILPRARGVLVFAPLCLLFWRDQLNPYPLIVLAQRSQQPILQGLILSSFSSPEMMGE